MSETATAQAAETQNDKSLLGADNPAPETADTTTQNVDGKSEADVFYDKDSQSDAADVEGAAEDGKAAPEKKAEEGEETTDKGKSDDTEEGEDGEKAEDEESKPLDLSDMKLPEGFKADSDVMEAFGKLAGDLGLTKEQAEQLGPVGALIAQKALANVNDGYADTRQQWRDEVAKDPVLGKPEEFAVATRVIKTFGSPELTGFLNATGLGDHPELARAFHKIGKALSEDSFVQSGSGGSNSEKSAADVMYDKTPS